MREKVEEVLELIRPGLMMDGGDVELVSVQDNGTVEVRLRGACHGCSMSRMTLEYAIERILKQRVPEVKSVVAVEEQ